jgi:hypothetical protein
MLLAAFIFKTSPEQISQLSIFSINLSFGKNIIIFFILLTASLSLTLALLFSSTRRGFLAALFIDSLFFFRIIKQDSIINTFLSAAFFIAVELFLYSKSKDKKSTTVIDKNQFK